MHHETESIQIDPEAFNVPLKPHPTVLEQKLGHKTTDIVFDLYFQRQMSYQQIANEYDCSVMSVKNTIKRMGVKSRGRGRPSRKLPNQA